MFSYVRLNITEWGLSLDYMVDGTVPEFLLDETDLKPHEHDALTDCPWLTVVVVSSKHTKPEVQMAAMALVLLSLE